MVISPPLDPVTCRCDACVRHTPTRASHLPSGFVEMGSETSDSVDDHIEVSRSKKNPGKAPRKIHKAEREKLKRDRMNELFTDLGKTLDLDHVNNGKASILRETIRLIGELLTQVESLKKENVTLLSESNYVTSEKNELLEETSALDAHVKRLQKEIDESADCATLDVSQPPCDFRLTEDHAAAFSLVGHTPESIPVVGSIFVVPFPEVNVPEVPSGVSRPRPRYPSSSDSWPSQILTRETNAVEDI